MNDRLEALSRRRLLAVGGVAVAGSLALSPDSVRKEMDLSVSVPDDAWPMVGRTPARTARTAATGPRPPFVERWSATLDTDERTAGTVVVADGAVVATGEQAAVGFDADDGRRRWTYRRRDEFGRVRQLRGWPSVVEGRVLLPLAGGLHAVADGQTVWSRQGALSPVVVVGSVAFVRSGSEVLAIDVATGVAHWRATGLAASHPVAFADGTLYCVAADAAVALDGATGESLWRSSGGVGPTGEFTGALSDDRLLVVGDDRPSVIALDRRDGAERWSLQSPARTSPPAVGEGRAHVVARGRETEPSVFALGTTDGRVRWRTEEPQVVRRRPALADGVLYARLAGGVLGLDPTDGEPLFRIDRPSGDGPLAVAGGRLYVAGDDRIHVLEESA